jgi:hypothetical protein
MLLSENKWHALFFYCGLVFGTRPLRSSSSELLSSFQFLICNKSAASLQQRPPICP